LPFLLLHPFPTSFRFTFLFRFVRSFVFFFQIVLHPFSMSIFFSNFQFPFSFLFLRRKDWTFGKEIKHLYQRATNDDYQKKGNQSFGNWEFFLVFFGFSQWYIATFGNILIKLGTTVSNRSWKGLSTSIKKKKSRRKRRKKKSNNNNNHKIVPNKE
jgi:hypothetical protein